MKRDLIISGILGLGASLLIFLGASWVKSFIPTLLPGLVPALAVFVVLLLTALAEMPMMVFALRKMAQSITMPRHIIAAGFSFYVLFAAIYAAILVLLTDASYIYLSVILAALGIVRVASGFFIR
jgi:hypothetical protein